MSDSTYFSRILDIPISGSVRYRWSRISDWVPTYGRELPISSQEGCQYPLTPRRIEQANIHGLSRSNTKGKPAWNNFEILKNLDVKAMKQSKNFKIVSSSSPIYALFIHTTESLSQSHQTFSFKEKPQSFLICQVGPGKDRNCWWLSKLFVDCSHIISILNNFIQLNVKSSRIGFVPRIFPTNRC
jgi:hypothetical protein